jgi:hypothetical protein
MRRPYLTKKLKPSYTSKTLEGSEPGRQVLLLRQLLKTKSTFLAPMLGKDRIHPELKQLSDGEYGVKFGRFPVSAQTCRLSPNATSALRRSSAQSSSLTKGWLLYEADFSQQEPRLYAHFAQCARLLKGYNSTPVIDVHSLAAELMGIDRQLAKTLGLSIFNGMTPKTLSGRLGVSELEARACITTSFRAFPR